MLSKSQAKAFFILGTTLFSAIFVGLTIDTFQKIPKQTNAQNLTETAIKGKHLFDKRNCMGCHTIFGEGAYYAPELTKVYERRGETFIRSMLKNPELMYPGQRKMTNYHFTDDEITSLVEFLKWVGTVDLNGFPAKPDLNAMGSSRVGANESSAAGIITKAPPALFNQMCTACHSFQGHGGQVGPALDDVGIRLTQDYIVNWLKDPMSIKPDSKMPKLPLSDNDVLELAAFLAAQKGK